MTFFEIVLQTSSSLHADGEPTDFITAYTGVIRCEDDEGVVRKVGRVLAYRVHVGLALNAGESLFDVFDAHGHEMHVLHTLLFEPDSYDYAEPVMAQFEAVEYDLFVVDYVILHPPGAA